ncbi:MAG: hypothetical protein SGILL_001066 [Bacillariaceae sp.]
MHLYDLYCGGGPLAMDRWDEDKDPERISKTGHGDQPPVMKTSPPSPTKSVPPKKVGGSNESMRSQSQRHEDSVQCHLLGYDSCAPGLALLSDSEDSSYTSCGTEEFFDFDDISNALNLMDSWSNCNHNGSNHTQRRHVRFSRAKVREYAITVGDHPICQDGLALSLDWIHTSEKVYSIDDYEFHLRRRSNLRQGRRRTSRLDYWQRREILLRVGSFSNKELSRIERERNQRVVSEFLDGGGYDAMGPIEDDLDDAYEVGVEQLLEMEPPEEDEMDSGFPQELCFESEWQMKVEVLED